MPVVYIYLLLAIEIMAVAGVAAAWVTRDTRWPFLIGFNTMLPVAVIQVIQSDAVVWRQMLVLGFVGLYLLRMNWVLLFWFAHTGAAKLKDHMSLPVLLSLPVIVTNAFGWLYCLPFFWTLGRTGAFDMFDGAALALYGIGTVIHFGADYQKRIFKQDPANRGKLIQTGFWGLSRHPNYVGDFLVYMAFAVSSASPFGLVAPLANLVQYLMDAIPKSEALTAQKYGDVWESYKSRVRCLVPYIY